MAASPVNRLELRLSPEGGPYGPVFDIYVDGVNFLERVRAFEAGHTDTIAGAYVPYLTLEHTRALLQLPRNGITPYACDCGEPFCWFLTFDAASEYGFVRWHRWSNPYRDDKSKAKDGLYWRYRDFPDLVFEQAAYSTAVERALATAIRK
ncbi:hypothetical protein [Kordiimonas aestuarii]|uniref:hypothetical protein n=1 Tax=Kordiimonas aestuarii TaxID=1005925 RepID=UPI0021D00FF8|nr:hypothetical protein [Kordiimonas aestuarii]